MTEHKFSETSRRLGAATFDLLSDHAELFALELQEQKQHSSQQLIWLGITAACGFMLFYAHGNNRSLVFLSSCRLALKGACT